jgi:hypothetical protein
MNPFDQLLRQANGETVVPPALGLNFPAAPIQTTGKNKDITNRILDLLAQRGRMTTRDLADACGFAKTNLIWGLMKYPRERGQVTCENGYWQLSGTHAAQLQHDINQAVQLLRKHNWTCTPPSEPNT